MGDLRRDESQPNPGARESSAHQCSPKTFVDLTLFSSQLDSKSVKHTALSLVSFILKRALKTIDYCLKKEVWQAPGVYTAAMMEDFVRLFREALSKVGTEARGGLPRSASRAFLRGHR